MNPATTSEREAARLRALDRYGLLDTPREQDFDEIAEAAAELCETPIAVVNLVGDGRQFFKAEVGLGVRETPLETSFCRQAILHNDFLYVPDATHDPRFAGNPLVSGEPGLRFYAGALLKTAEGQPIGTVCVLDTRPRELSERQRRGLMRLARQAMTQMELRRSLREQAEQRLLHERILDSATDYAIVAMDPQGRVTRWNTGAERILGWTEAEMLGRTVDAFFTPEDRAEGRAEVGLIGAGFRPARVLLVVSLGLGHLGIIILTGRLGEGTFKGVCHAFLHSFNAYLTPPAEPLQALPGRG